MRQFLYAMTFVGMVYASYLDKKRARNALPPPPSTRRIAEPKAKPMALRASTSAPLWGLAYQAAKRDGMSDADAIATANNLAPSAGGAA